MKRISPVAACVVLLVMAACQPPGPATLSEEDIAGIEAATQAWLEAVNAGDWAALGATYTEDAVLLPPNEPVVQGRSDIQAWFEAFPPVSDINLETEEIEGLGDVAFVRGSYTLTITPEGMDAVTDTGKFLDVRRKQADGSWLIYRDIFSSNLTAAQ